MKKIKRSLKNFRNKLRLFKVYILSNKLCRQLKKTLPCCSEIPVIIISYNNGKYVENTCNQLEKFNIKPVIIDNHSTDQNTLRILKNLHSSNNAYVVYSSHNFGHGVGFIEPVYKLLPDVFAYTDPDLLFNTNLPDNFLQILANLATEFSAYKAGFALSLENDSDLKETLFHSVQYKPFKFEKTYNIKELESRYWVRRLAHSELEIYAAEIDTTFAVYRKENYNGNFHDAIRVAGNFSAIHMPWFKSLELLNHDEKKSYLKKNRSSNWVK